MSDYRVIPYRPDMLPEIVRLWEDHGRTDVARRRELFQWFSEGNPFLLGRPPYYCLHDGERVVGMHGYMPLLIDVDGVEQRGQMAQDDLLHASCRGKGLHKVLLDGAIADAPNLAGAMWFNEINHRSYLKCGWTDVPGFRRFVFFLDAARLADELGERRALAVAVRAVGPLALGLLRARLRRARRSEIRIDAIDGFDDRYERLYRKLAPGLGIAVRRSAAYLDWRFVKKPNGEYRRLAATAPGGELAGWLVYRIDRSEGAPVLRILDLLADPAVRGAHDSLVATALDAAREAGATHAVAAGSHPEQVRQLRRLGFLASPRPEYHMVTSWEGKLPREQVTDISRWYLTLSDADGDAWV